jgi:single-stranded DNA-binding protein
MNEFTILGVLESVGPLEETSSGIKVVNFVITVTRPFKSNQSADEFKVTAFKELAEDITSSAIIGTSVLVRGRLQSNNYRRDDKVYYSPELLAEKVMYVVK